MLVSVHTITSDLPALWVGLLTQGQISLRKKRGLLWLRRTLLRYLEPVVPALSVRYCQEALQLPAKVSGAKLIQKAECNHLNENIGFFHIEQNQTDSISKANIESDSAIDPSSVVNSGYVLC